MRELSLVELELIVGGYDSGGGGESYSYSNSAMSVDADGNASGNIAAGDEQGVTNQLSAQGISISDIPIEIKVGPITLSTKIGKKKKK